MENKTNKTAEMWEPIVKENMKILIPTCDDYIKHIEALQLSMRNTSLSQFERVIIGYDPPKFQLDPNWSFVSMGKQRGPSFWSNDMNEFLKDYPDEFFIYGNDDCAITYFDQERFDHAVWMVNTWKNIGRFALMAEGKARPILPYYICEDEAVQPAITVNQFSSEADYRLSLGWSIYNKKCFMQFCQNGQDPWEFERGSCHGKNSEELIKWSFLTFNPEGEAIDAAFFRRKHIQGVIPEWHKGYYGHDLEGEIKDEVEKILFRKL